MKIENKILIGLATCALALGAWAASPAWVTKMDPGNAASPAEVIFAPQDQAQLRLVNISYASDTNNAGLSISGGSTLYSIQETNQATTSTTNKINSTNGLAGSSILVLMHNGVGYAASISTFNSSTNAGWYGGTNVVLAAGGWGVGTSVGDQVFLMDSPVTLPVGVGTNSINGEAIYVAALSGRPVRVVLSPANVTNRLNSVVGKYD